MKQKIMLAAVAVLLLAGAGGGAWWLLTVEDREDEEHYRRGETLVTVAGVPGAPLRLFRSGSRLADTAAVSLAKGPEIWLGPGNYFLRAGSDRLPLSLPIPLTGYRSGPDKEGSFLVAVRPPPDRLPPSLLDAHPAFAYIPSGSFLMGDRNNPREYHHVWLSGYFLATFEATNLEFRKFLDAPDGYAADRYWTEEGKKWKGENGTRCSAAMTPGHRDGDRFGRPDQPLTWVTWYEANAFCAWMTGTIGGGVWQFALPSEAEWEKGARGPDNFDYSLSMTVSDAEVALYNWKKNPDSPVTVVGIEATRLQYVPNRYGLYHMTGNVAEWTQSVDRPFNREHPFLDDDRNNNETPGQRIVRGGSWYSASSANLLTAYRDAFPPAHSTQEVGFRIAARRLP